MNPTIILIVILATLGGAGGIYFYGEHNGAERELARCAAATKKIQDALQQSKDNYQKAVNQKAREYEKERADADLLLSDIKKRLRNEKNRNAAFASCHAGAEFLRLYGELAGTGAADRDSSEPGQ